MFKFKKKGNRFPCPYCRKLLYENELIAVSMPDFGCPRCLRPIFTAITKEEAAQTLPGSKGMVGRFVGQSQLVDLSQYRPLTR